MPWNYGYIIIHLPVAMQNIPSFQFPNSQVSLLMYRFLFISISFGTFLLWSSVQSGMTFLHVRLLLRHYLDTLQSFGNSFCLCPFRISPFWTRFLIWNLFIFLVYPLLWMISFQRNRVQKVIFFFFETWHNILKNIFILFLYIVNYVLCRLLEWILYTWRIWNASLFWLSRLLLESKSNFYF